MFFFLVSTSELYIPATILLRSRLSSPIVSSPATSSYLSSHGLERRADGVATLSIECAALQPQTAARADRMANEECLKPASAAELRHCGILVRTR